MQSILHLRIQLVELLCVCVSYTHYSLLMTHIKVFLPSLFLSSIQTLTHTHTHTHTHTQTHTLVHRHSHPPTKHPTLCYSLSQFSFSKEKYWNRSTLIFRNKIKSVAAKWNGDILERFLGPSDFWSEP